LKTLRHKFAVYCDDIVAGADTLEKLFELFDALVCCCAKAGIHIKAAKVKFGVEKVTFHNFTITLNGIMSKGCQPMHHSELENTNGCVFSEGIFGMQPTNVGILQGPANHLCTFA
jgi:hypothetical protein